MRPVLPALLRFQHLGLLETTGGDAVFQGKPVCGGAAELERRRKRRRKRRREHGNGLRPGKRRPEGFSFGRLWLKLWFRGRSGGRPAEGVEKTAGASPLAVAAWGRLSPLSSGSRIDRI